MFYHNHCTCSVVFYFEYRVLSGFFLDKMDRFFIHISKKWVKALYYLALTHFLATILSTMPEKISKRKATPDSVLFFAFANFYGQFVNLPLRGFGHDKLTLKSSRKRSGTEDGELKTKCRVLRFLLLHFSN